MADEKNKTEKGATGNTKGNAGSKEKAQDKEKSDKGWQETLVEKIAGNNEVMKQIVRFVTSPYTLILGVLALIFWNRKSRAHKEELAKKDEEIKMLNARLEGIEEKLQGVKKCTLLSGENEQPEREKRSLAGFSKHRYRSSILR